MTKMPDEPPEKKGRYEDIYERINKGDPFESGADNNVSLNRLNSLLRPSMNMYFCA
jgi:hypothetical protein